MKAYLRGRNCMENEDRIKALRDRQKKLNKKNIDMSYLVVVVLVIILIIIDYFVLDAMGGFSLAEFLKETIGNLMGVLAAFLIFDIIHDKMAKDSYALEVSERILETLFDQEGMEALDDEVKKKFIFASLVSVDKDKEAAGQIAKELELYLQGGRSRAFVLDKINMLTEQQKYKFVESNVKSIASDRDISNMIQNFLANYLVGELDCKIRTSFEYNIVLRRLPENNFNVLKRRDDYYMVEETITYKVKYPTEALNNTKSSQICIGFAYDNKNLDKLLRNRQVDHVGDPLKNCIFRESLDINPEDAAYFTSLSPEELKECFQDMFKLHLSIDGKAGEVSSVSAAAYGVVVEFTVGHDGTKMEHSVDMAFAMPRKWNSQLEVVFVDPTRNPRISLNYDGETMRVEMFSFLDKGEDTSYENTHTEDIGIYRVALNDTWVYPVSGVLFTIDRKEENDAHACGKVDAALQAARTQRSGSICEP